MNDNTQIAIRVHGPRAVKRAASRWMSGDTTDQTKAELDAITRKKRDCTQ